MNFEVPKCLQIKTESTRSYFIFFFFLNIHIQDILFQKHKNIIQVSNLHFCNLRYQYVHYQITSVSLDGTEISGISILQSLNTDYTHSEQNCIVIYEMKDDHTSQ